MRPPAHDAAIAPNNLLEFGNRTLAPRSPDAGDFTRLEVGTREDLDPRRLPILREQRRERRMIGQHHPPPAAHRLTHRQRPELPDRAQSPPDHLNLLGDLDDIRPGWKRRKINQPHLLSTDVIHGSDHPTPTPRRALDDPAAARRPRARRPSALDAHGTTTPRGAHHPARHAPPRALDNPARKHPTYVTPRAMRETPGRRRMGTPRPECQDTPAQTPHKRASRCSKKTAACSIYRGVVGGRAFFYMIT